MPGIVVLIVVVAVASAELIRQWWTWPGEAA